MVKHWQSDQEDQLRELGTYLQQQRQARELTIEAVSEKTRIRSGLIMALEAGHLEELPEPIYLQGFVKRYAEFLGLDGNAVSVSIPTPISARLPHSSGEPPIRFHTSSLKTPFSLSSNVLVALGGIALLLGMLTGFQVWSQGQEGRRNVAESPEPVEVTPLPTVAPPVPQSLQFYLEATGETWLEVTIDGEIVLSDIVSEGFTQTWIAQEKAGIYVARSEAVKIAIDDRTPQIFGTGGEKEASFPVLKPTQ